MIFFKELLHEEQCCWIQGITNISIYLNISAGVVWIKSVY